MSKVAGTSWMTALAANIPIQSHGEFLVFTLKLALASSISLPSTQHDTKPYQINDPLHVAVVSDEDVVKTCVASRVISSVNPAAQAERRCVSVDDVMDITTVNVNQHLGYVINDHI